MRFDVLVLDAALRQSLIAVRSLGRHGRSVAALDSSENAPAFSSRWCRRGFVCSAGRATDAYLARLEELLETPVGVLLASHDGTIALLRQHRARLEQKVRLALASEPALAIAVNKERTLAVARRLGIVVPPSVVVRSVDELPTALREVGLPAVIKPTESWLWDERGGARVASQVVVTPDEAQRAVAKLTGSGGVTLCQRLLSGRREAVSLLYANGVVHARFAQWEKRTNPPLGGEGVLRQAIAVPPDVGSHAQRLVREIDLEGYSQVEFRRDAAGVPHLMEINPRLSASVELAVRSGVDFPYLLHQWASGAPVDTVERYRVGGWLRYLAGDLEATLGAMEQRGRPDGAPPLQALLGFSRSFFMPVGYDGVDWNDPRPTLKGVADLTTNVLRRVVRKLYGQMPQEDLVGPVTRIAPSQPVRPVTVPATAYDTVVIGAGPYGLSTAAHLIRRGLRVAVFGKPMELWRNHMPQGMLLRSHWWATNLSDPRKQFGFDRFFRESRHRKSFPVPLETFIEYGLWFQKRAVPNVDETYVSSIERHNGHFRLTLEDGRTVQSAAVVMATGPYAYANRPAEYNDLPSGLVSHSCDHHDLRRFKGQHILVIGGGMSAIDYAALLSEAGATVHVVSRRPILWFAPDRTDDRSMLEKVSAPNNSIAPGWENWILEHVPYLFYRFPQHLKDRYNSNYVSGATSWLRERVIGKAALHDGCTVLKMEPVSGKVDVTISDGAQLRVDHVLLATGYKVNIDKLTMIHPALLAEIKSDAAVPVLTRSFESSVPGLYFVGLTSFRAFGLLYRFVVGCDATARRVAKAEARRVARSRTVMSESLASSASRNRSRARISSARSQCSPPQRRCRSREADLATRVPQR